MARFYISALGIGGYNESVYFQGEHYESPKTRYVQIATLSLWKCNEWTLEQDDRIVLLVTEGAMDNCYKDHEDRNGQMVPGLESEMLRLGIPRKMIHVVDIKNGKNDGEIMEIFDLLNKEFEGCKSPELYYDLTYGLRYIPMLMVVFNNYSRFVYNSKCVHIAYGSFQTPDEKGRAPIIDLKWLDSIQEWSTAAENFISSGNPKKLEEIAITNLKESYGQDTSMRHLRRVVDYVRALTSDFQVCMGKNIIQGDKFGNLYRIIEEKMKEDLPRPFIPLLKDIKNSFVNFSSDENWKNGIKAAAWCFEHQLYQQSLTLLQETSISCLCQSLNLDWQNKDHREIVSGYRYYICQVLPGADKKKKKCDEKNAYQPKVFLSKTSQLHINFILEHENLKQWIDVVDSCTEPRNQYNHGGMLRKKENELIPQKIISSIEKQLKKALELIKEDDVHFIMDEKAQNKESLFINVSNHPSSTTWSPGQIAAAEKYGRIVDIPFPDVQSDAGKDDLQKLMDDVVAQVVEQTDGITSSVVHIMGEMNLTFMIVTKLMKMGYKCVASTTKRNVTVDENGIKKSTFEFTQFREYMFVVTP